MKHVQSVIRYRLIKQSIKVWLELNLTAFERILFQKFRAYQCSHPPMPLHAHMLMICSFSIIIIVIIMQTFLGRYQKGRGRARG